MVEIHWPSGLAEQVVVPGIDSIVTITEGKGTPVVVERKK
jgi:hypothetical protein